MSVYRVSHPGYTFCCYIFTVWQGILSLMCYLPATEHSLIVIDCAAARELHKQFIEAAHDSRFYSLIARLTTSD